MLTRNDITIISKNNNEYIIEVYLHGFKKEKIEKQLTNIDNSHFKTQWLKFHRGTYTHQFHLSDNPYLDSLHWIRICKYLSEKGEAIVVRITDKQKTYYVPAKIIEKQPNQIIVEYWNGEKGKIADPNDYQIILNNPKREPDLIKLGNSVDLLVSIRDEISRERIISHSPQFRLKAFGSVSAEEEITEFRKDFEGNNFIVVFPPNTKSAEDSRPLSRLGELRKKSNEVEDCLKKEIYKDVKKNKPVKYNERLKALNEMKRKWGIELTLNSRY
ncbi:MAG: hypothetical protein I3273_00885 [Candidatus Moeniiplasma glomeromycotorum]|nr:hypothetical protein [Candidatus Moeniiplasma glomeromycotorum]MCE8167320.1 hypothetical protein [Candidatus Moeniiplasma glomeromycotorum]MCE8168666.1 hypothetical protein [Candidatus Moeniiplasma glomeromycotorum]